MGYVRVDCTASSAKVATLLNVKSLKGGRYGNRGRCRDPSQSCDHCQSPNHTVNWFLKKQNDDLKTKIDLLVKKVDAIRKAKMVQEEDSDYSDSIAWLATAHQARARGSMWNLDSACSNTLATPSTDITTSKLSSLSLRTADDSLIKVSVSGIVKLPIHDMSLVCAHVISNLAKLLLSVSDLIDWDKAEVLFKNRALIVDQPEQLERWCTD